jgi:hypothetical protein
MNRFNPFRPGGIVAPGMFAGRGDELIALERVLFQTKNENPHHFLIHGERGIGKSSLFFYLQGVAKGEMTSLEDEGFRFLVLSIELEPTNSYSDIIRKIGSELERAVRSYQPAKRLVRDAWDFLKGWEIMGVKYKANDRSVEPHELVEELSHSVDRTISNLADAIDGILVLIDEADKPPSEAHLGEFVKVFTERLTKRGCNKVTLGLAGLPALIQKLRRSHESSPRIFDIFTLEPLSPNERVGVIRLGLAAAKEKNGYEVSVTEEAERWISVFSEGYPHFIQQFAHCAFTADSDNEIDIHDVWKGAFGENGAFQQLGLKYYHDLYFEQINSDEYRKVLRAMSDHFDDWVSKAQIRAASGLKESTLANAIAALKKRNIIIAHDGRKAMYRLPTKSFAVWIKSYTEASSQAQASGEVNAVMPGLGKES